ncbi:MAG: response regulator [Methanoregula sp.]|nr:response regulator [Methanoregula sp.]
MVEENVPVTGVTQWNNRTSPNGVPLKKNHTPSPPSGMISVLYVDDELNLLDVTKTYLEKTKEFTVTTAPSASVALELLKSNGIQVIVSDYQMPEMDGIEFLKTVRATDKSIPFIIFTGKGREEIAIEAFENGADFYLQKGGEPKSQFADLSHRIKKAVDHRRADIQVTALNRLYTVLSATNKAIVRIHDKTELLKRYLPGCCRYRRICNGMGRICQPGKTSH